MSDEDVIYKLYMCYNTTKYVDLSDLTKIHYTWTRKPVPALTILVRHSKPTKKYLFCWENDFFFLLNKKKGSPVWVHRPNFTWQQWIIPRVPHRPCWGYRSNCSSLDAGRGLLPSSHTPCGRKWNLGVM